MKPAIVKLCYKQMIDTSSTGDFEKQVLKASYDEFLLKSQTYNMEGKFKTFTQLKTNDGRANSLHYKLGFAVGHFIDRLNKNIPELRDNLDNTVNFDIARFELIESDITDMVAHKVAINYITTDLILCSIIGEYLVLAKGNANPDETVDTFTLKMQPGISIVNYRAQPSVNNIPLSAHAGL
ncbi:MAG: hypothetical protein ACXVAY_02610 [Mucilaginibacter sp.]